MKRQGWHPSPDSVAFFKDGKLLNGQNRLMACVASGVPIIANVITGLGPEVFAVTDSGKGRTQADRSRLDPALLSDVNLIGAMTGQLVWNRLPTGVESDMATWWRPAHEALGDAAGWRRVRHYDGCALRVGAGLRWAICQQPEAGQYVLEQWGAMIQGELDGMSRATGALWKRIAGKGIGGTRERKIYWAAMMFYGLAPGRAQIEPLMRHPEETLEEMRGWLALMETAYLASDGPHPYRFVERPATVRRVHMPPPSRRRELEAASSLML
jgi:hypothetical protein